MWQRQLFTRLQNLAEEVFTDFEFFLPLRKTSKYNLFQIVIWKLNIFISSCILFMFLKCSTFLLFLRKEIKKFKRSKRNYCNHFILLWIKWSEQFFVTQRWWNLKCFSNIDWSQRSKQWYIYICCKTVKKGRNLLKPILPQHTKKLLRSFFVVGQ